MAVDAIVKRGAGDRPAPEISSALMVSKKVAGAAGAYVVDHDSSNRLQVAIDLVDTSYVERGLIVEVAEEEEIWRGMTVGFERELQLDGDEYQVRATLDVEREERT